MLSKPFNYTNFLANHIIDGFFVNFQEKWQMKMVLKKSSNNKKVKHFTGKGFDANGEHFDVTKGSILESGMRLNEKDLSLIVYKNFLNNL